MELKDAANTTFAVGHANVTSETSLDTFSDAANMRGSIGRDGDWSYIDFVSALLIDNFSVSFFVRLRL